MRRLLIVSLFAIAGASSTAYAADDVSNTSDEVVLIDSEEENIGATKEDDVDDVGEEAESRVDARTPETPVQETRIDPLEGYNGRPDAKRLTTDTLWDDFDDAFGRFQDFLAESEEAPAETQTGFRSRVRAIGAAMEVRDLLGALLDSGELSTDESIGAQDSYLTVQQVMGSMMVDIGECERAVKVLRKLENNPDTHERALLLKGTKRWLAKAERCDERQKLEAQIAAREFEADEEELARLRRQLESSKDEEARADAQDRIEESDDLTLSRGELLDLLRQSAASRHEKSALDTLFGTARKGLPTHEYGINLYAGIGHTPNFIIRGMMEPGMRVEPEPRGHYGLAFFVRKNARKRDISLNYDYTSFDLGEHWWLRKDQPRGDARWLDIGMVTKHTITVGVDRNFVFGAKERFQIHIGGLFGLSVLPNNAYDRSKVKLGCLIGINKEKKGHLDRFQEGGECYDRRDPDGRVKLPPVLPSLGLRAGLRYVIADRVQVGVQGGFQDGYFFANGVVGVIVGRKFRPGERPE